MSVLPILFADTFSLPRPSRILNQHYGLGLDGDLLSPLTVPKELNALPGNPACYYRPWRTQASQKDTGSTVSVDKDKFQVNLDVQQFTPEEITVKITGENTITVEGKHEEKQDEHGFISRHFVRKYVLPKGHDINQVVSNLSSDGVLTITAPKTNKETKPRNIPIQQTKKPVKSIEKKPKL